MLRYYVQKTQDEVSRLRVADYLRKSRDRVLDSGLAHFWFRKWVVAAVAAIALLLVGIALLVTSDIDFDTFLNYFALGLLVFVLITLFYGIMRATTCRTRSPSTAITRIRTRSTPPAG